MGAMRARGVGENEREEQAGSTHKKGEDGRLTADLQIATFASFESLH